MPYIARSHQLKQSLLYHIFNRSHNRVSIFKDKADYRFFIEILSNYSKQIQFYVYHWVIMPNHYHLVLELSEPERISSVMAGIGRSYACYHHRKYKTAGYLWQGRFKSQPIQKELYLNACGRYIERNPVKAGMVEDAWEYPYSSAAYYSSEKKDNITAESPLFENFGTSIEIRREKYKYFLLDFDAEEEILFDNIEFPRGSEEFKKRLVKENGRFMPRRQGRISV